MEYTLIRTTNFKSWKENWHMISKVGIISSERITLFFFHYCPYAEKDIMQVISENQDLVIGALP